MMRILGLWMALVVFAIPVSAQMAGRLTGSVVDSGGSAVTGATVDLMLPGGAEAVFATVTNGYGLFSFTGVRPDSYDLVVGAPGFQKYTLRGINVDPARETTLPVISLSIEPVSFSVVVTAPAQTVQTANAEVATTITNEQVRRLPVLDRYPLHLIRTQAGVNNSGSSVVINGERPSSSNVTLDGINIQDNYVRANSLTYTPNLIALDQISEFTLVTSNGNATMGGGASQVSFVTPSGTNQLHGSVYFYNRNSALAATSWFDNKDGVEKSSFNQNQMGGTIGGPIKRDKLHFYGNYEAFRYRLDFTTNTTILTQDARNGVFTYEDVTGQVHKVNILQAAGVSADPAMEQLLRAVPGPDNINNFRVGDSRLSLLRNTAGYSLSRQGYHNRDNITLKLDYTLSTANVFTGSFLLNRQDVTRSDLSNDFSTVPKVRNDDTRKLVSAAWRWHPRPSFTNELRGGFNLAPLTFTTSENFGERIVAGMIYSNPVNVFQTQGRNTDTFTVMDNAAYARGKHNVQFGFQTQQIRIATSDNSGIIPTYLLGIGVGNTGLSAQQLPGVGSTDLTGANNLLATLAGYITGYSQTFNIVNRNSGFVNGASNSRHYSLNTYALYLHDAWKLNTRLTLNLGLRYELPGIVDEEQSLALLPMVQDNDPIRTLLSNSVLNFAGSSAGRAWYTRDNNNWAPNVGLAWDIREDGKTALRAGYSISYVNDEAIRAVENNVGHNEGLVAIVSRTGLSGRVSTGLPSIPVPTFKVPRTFEDNYRLNPFSAFGLPDPNLRTPYVQQWSIGIQRAMKAAILEVRYVGNHSTKLFRAFDVNPEVIIENGFLDDFKRARENGNQALAATGVFDPNFNPNLPGSRPLTVFPTLALGGLLNNPIVRNLVQTGEAGQLAFVYHINGLAGPVSFYRNPISLASNLITNYSSGSYNALQIDVLRRFHRGLQFQANYTYGKVLSDSDGLAQHRFEEFRDPKNPKIDRARPSFDVTHALKGNAVYDLPIEVGPKALSIFLSGWTISGLTRWQSGNPFSVLSGRGTVLRTLRSGQNTAASPLSKAQLDDVLQFRMTTDGPFIVAASALGSDGRAVAPDGIPPFNGQAFFNPDSGAIGALQRRWFSGPWTFDLDLALLKKINVTESNSLEMRVEALNVLNHPTWFVQDQDINSVNFGRIANTFNTPRQIQLSLHWRF